MGAGGITATVVQVGKQKTAYVVIDGNNMISGLREKILAALTSLGFNESEVFTTDTHAVSALSSGRSMRRGYHPVGEAMSHELLIGYIIDVAKKAESNLESSKAEPFTLLFHKSELSEKPIFRRYLRWLTSQFKRQNKCCFPSSV